MDAELIRRSANIGNLGEFLAWDSECDECHVFLREECRRHRRVGTVHSVVSRIARLEAVRNSLRRRFAPVGAGYLDRGGLHWLSVETAFENRVLTGLILNEDYIEPRDFLKDAESTVLEQIRGVMMEHNSVKINTMFNGEFVAGERTCVKSIATRNSEVFSTTDLRDWYARRVVDATLTSLEEFQERDSGWALSRILNLTINVNKFNPLRAGCYIQLPSYIVSKKAVINVQSTDNACFAWAVVAALYPVREHSERASRYPHYSTVLNLRDIEFPMTLSQITKFEKRNSISINVFTDRGGSIVPLRLTDNKREKHVNLLYVVDSRNNSAHFAWIKNLSRLLNNQLSKYSGKKYICDR